MARDPLFLRFANKKVSVEEMLSSFSSSTNDQYTLDSIQKARKNIPNLEDFHKEFVEALTDIINEGVGEEFTAFVNHYMESSLVEDRVTSDGQFGDNVSVTVRVRDIDSSWIEGLICYNICLYIKAFGLDNLKKCRICDTFFNHKGKYAVYCSDSCKSQSKNKKV
jgi:hypothetical protein